MSAVAQPTFNGLNFGFVVRPTLRLYDVLIIMERTRVLGAKPSRHTLIAMIESGEIEGKLTRVGWVVFEDSLAKWFKQFSEVAA